MKRWECVREEWERGVRPTGGWMAEEEVEKKKTGRKRHEMKGMKAPKQRDELKQDSHHSCVLFFSLSFSLSVLHIFPQLNKGWLTHNYQSLFDPDGCEASSTGEDACESEIKWGHGCRCMVNWVWESHTDSWHQSPTISSTISAGCVVVTLAYVQLNESHPCILEHSFSLWCSMLDAFLHFRFQLYIPDSKYQAVCINIERTAWEI